jgi:4-diphosphocytidyl-2-C-methyl-D-erythritol kinase
MAAIEERARAKVNLTLKILGRRADGYHALESLIVFAGIGDTLRFEPGGAPSVAMTGPFAEALSGSNLADTALERLAALGADLTLGRVTIDKHLPITAGIGGGSADAAAVLRAVRRANPERAGSVDWPTLAAGLGADVPVCLADRSALVWGFGERLTPAPGLPPLHAVLVCPSDAAPLGKTRSVFARLSVPSAGAEALPAPLPKFANAAALIDYMRAIGNDLRAPAHAVLPASAEAHAALAALPGCRHAGLSGAGPTSFGIFDEASAAAGAADRRRSLHPRGWIVATTIGD